MILKMVKVVCDECFEASATVPGASQDEAWRTLSADGWRRFKHPSGAAWRGRVHVCRRCVEYGRPYRRDAEGRVVAATQRRAGLQG